MAKGKFDMSEFLAPVEGVPESDTTQEIAVDDILDNPLNFLPETGQRKARRADGIHSSKRTAGAADRVTAENGKYRLISGHSRMNAVRLLAS